MRPMICKIALSSSAILQQASRWAVSNNAHMGNARDAVVREVEQMLVDLDMKPSPFAKEAGVATTTLTRFLGNEDAPLLSTSTLVKLREARDRILAERGTAPNLSHLTKNAKKRALIARLLALPDDQVVAFENAIESTPQAPTRKPDDAA